jgi:hypothetical protein
VRRGACEARDAHDRQCRVTNDRHGHRAIGGVAAHSARGSTDVIDSRFAGGFDNAPLEAAVTRRSGRETKRRAASAPGGSLRQRKPVTQQAAALEALFRADWERAAPRSRGDPALTAESYLRARIVVEHVLLPELAAPLTLLAARYA